MSRFPPQLLFTLCALLTSCLTSRDEVDPDRNNPCTPCHGSIEHAEDPLIQSAPPADLKGNEEPEFPGVGAHLQHVLDSETHGAVACDECHVVPEATDTPGHADSAPPAELTFGAHAEFGDHHPRYAFDGRTCTNTYCHGSTEPVWTRPRDSACGTCHELPPAPPHPQSDRCEVCHADLADSRHFVSPARHVDTVIDFAEPDCDACHGSPDNPAPPLSLDGASDPSSPHVGAHQAHLAGGGHSRPVPCEACHPVPASVERDEHPNGGSVNIVFSDVAVASGRSPEWVSSALACTNTWCHGPGAAAGQSSPAWTEAGPLGCTSCHGSPPAPPHPQVSDCARCHGAVAGSEPDSIAFPERHVDGTVQVEVSEDCTSCHGSVSPAPPPDLAGATDTAAPGVGAHTAHLIGRNLARPVACDECHLVPAQTLDPGHVDSPAPAELVFSGVAIAFEASPAYEGRRCFESFCHGDSFIGGASGGTTTVPDWTVVDGSQIQCTSCHGLPPPAPHPPDTDNCSECHLNATDELGFTRPDLHVDGVVTFSLPEDL